MNTQRNLNLKKYTLALVIGWSLINIVSALWGVSEVKKDILETAHIKGQVALQKDLLYRRWNANHGGVYVQVTEKTKPNIYLVDLQEREIITPSGKLLTMMNPAYMSRQVYELETEISDVRSHITSLNPIKPENAPDPWEKKALESFEQGEKKVASIDSLEGQEYFRFMRPLITEKGCLKCHAKQGYKENDIRGGISVSIPMAPLWTISSDSTQKIKLVFLFIWFIGLGGIAVGHFRLSKSERIRNEAEVALGIAYKNVEKQVVERTSELQSRIDELHRWHNVTLDREELMIELKKEVNELLKQLGKPEKYKS